MHSNDGFIPDGDLEDENVPAPFSGHRGRAGRISRDAAGRGPCEVAELRLKRVLGVTGLLSTFGWGFAEGDLEHFTSDTCIHVYI